MIYKHALPHPVYFIQKHLNHLTFGLVQWLGGKGSAVKPHNPYSPTTPWMHMMEEKNQLTKLSSAYSHKIDKQHRNYISFSVCACGGQRMTCRSRSPPSAMCLRDQSQVSGVVAATFTNGAILLPLFCFLETELPGAQAGLELVKDPSDRPKCWDGKCVPPCSAK